MPAKVKSGQAAGTKDTGSGKANALQKPLRPSKELAAAPNVGKPTDERRLLAALARAVAP